MKESKPFHDDRIESSCARVKSELETRTKWFVDKGKEAHGDTYDYSLAVVDSLKMKIKIICKKHGIFEQNASNHIHLKNGCPSCANTRRKQRSISQRSLEENIREKARKELEIQKEKDYMELQFILS